MSSESIPPGPYFSHYGPLDGPVRERDPVPAIGIVRDEGTPWPLVGIAFPWGWIEHWKGSVTTFRLVIGKAEAPELYVLDRRRFVPVDDWEPAPFQT